MTVAIEIGRTEAGQPATLDLEELLATRLLVQGNSGSGKSHLLRRLMEQSAPWVQQAVIDPEGDFVALADAFDHLVIDAAAQTEAGLQHVAATVRMHRVSVVLNLEGLDAEHQMRHAAAFLGGLFDADRDHWSPLLVVVDEAQLFAPAGAVEVTDEARRLSLAAMTNLMCRGRKRGLAGVIATQRLAKLAKNVAAEATNFLMGRTFLDIDMARAADLLGMERRAAEAFRDLGRGQFIALGPALARRPLAVRIGAVATESRSASPGLVPLPGTAAEDVRAMILSAVPPAPRATPRRPAPAPGSTGQDLLAELARARPAPVQEPDAAPAEADPARIEAILTAMLAEPEAGFRPVPVLYQDFLVRCRIAALGGKPMDLPGFRRRLTTARAGISVADGDTPEWQRAMQRGARLPDDMQGIFLMVARAARDGLPCPSDETIGRAYGTRSAGRARRLLSYMEEQGLIVCQSDPAGRRVVTLTELAWQTAPGDPNAEAA